MIYADNAATTPLDKDAFEAMKPYWWDDFGNPSQLYSLSRSPKSALKSARETIANCIGADPDGSRRQSRSQRPAAAAHA